MVKNEACLFIKIIGLFAFYFIEQACRVNAEENFVNENTKSSPVQLSEKDKEFVRAKADEAVKSFANQDVATLQKILEEEKAKAELRKIWKERNDMYAHPKIFHVPDETTGDLKEIKNVHSIHVLVAIYDTCVKNVSETDLPTREQWVKFTCSEIPEEPITICTTIVYFIKQEMKRINKALENFAEFVEHISAQYQNMFISLGTNSTASTASPWFHGNKDEDVTIYGVILRLVGLLAERKFIKMKDDHILLAS